MNKCVIDYTVINSQPSIEALDKLIYEFFWVTQGVSYRIDDIYYYGVFFKPQNYVNFNFCESVDYDFEIPEVLTSECSTDNGKLAFVNKVIKQIMHKEITKPEWMKYIEMNMNCNEFGMHPSTFLYLEAKDSKYNSITDRLIEFLYSANLTMTMLNADIS